ncbi:MAG: hypothetical protein IH588_07100 [Anaerolineales bacterium]|nr:hypothetical protein [Anaerolineales bacterium]MBL8101302.1 hypothetical protein [Anaerolineales bacterium]
MAYSHTNSKGTTYYLHTNGKMFFFSREIKEGAIDALPAGKVVVEMKTGMLVLKNVPAEGAAKPAETTEASS